MLADGVALVSMQVLVWQGGDGARPSGLVFSGAAPIRRESFWADSCFQNRLDLAAAERRPAITVGRDSRPDERVHQDMRVGWRPW